MERRLLQLGRVDVHHDDLCGTGPGLPVIAHLTDGNAGAHSQDQVCILDRPVAGPVAHIASAAAIKRIFVFDQVHSVPVSDHWNIQLFCHAAERLVAARQADAVSSVEHWALCLPDLFQHSFDRSLLHRRGKLRIVLSRVVALQFIRFDVTALIVDRNVQPDRAGAAGRSQMPCLFQRIADLFGVLDHRRKLGHAADRLDDIVLLVAHCTQRGAGVLQGIAGRGVVTHLTADDEHRDAVQPAAHNTGQSIRAARPGRHADRRDLIFQPRVSFRRNGAGLLVVVVGHMQLLVVAQCVIQVHCTTAHDREHIGHAFFRKKVCDIIS